MLTLLQQWSRAGAKQRQTVHRMSIQWQVQMDKWKGAEGGVIAWDVPDVYKCMTLFVCKCIICMCGPVHACVCVCALLLLHHACVLACVCVRVCVCV